MIKVEKKNDKNRQWKTEEEKTVVCCKLCVSGIK